MRGCVGASSTDDPYMYFDRKDGDPDKTPVVFDAPYLGTHETMLPYAEFFQKKGHTTLVWDYPGYGDSGDLPFGVSYTVGGMVDALTTVMSQAGIDEHVFFVYSSGGIIAIAEALRNPSKCAGLVGISTSHNGLLLARAPIRSWQQQRTKQPANERVAFGDRTFDERALADLAVSFSLTNLPAETLATRALLYAGDNDVVVPMSTTIDLIGRLSQRGQCRSQIVAGGDHNMYFSRQAELLGLLDEDYEFMFGPRQ